jgi:hypothetical protein
MLGRSVTTDRRGSHVVGIVMLAACCLPLVASAATDALWFRHWTGANRNDDSIVALATDAAGNVYATGCGYRVGESLDFVTARYNQDGLEQWRSYYSGSGHRNDGAVGICLDNAGNVYVTGTSYEVHADTDFTFEITTVKYNGTTGAQLWARSYHGWDAPGGPWWFVDEAVGIAYDSVFDRVFVLGNSFKNHDGYWDYDFNLHRLNPANGDTVWMRVWNSGISSANQDDQPTAITIGPNRDPVVCGYWEGSVQFVNDWAVVRCSSANGRVAWDRRISFDNDDSEQPNGICADPNGNVYVTGSRWNYANAETRFALVKIRGDNSRVDTSPSFRRGDADAWGSRCRYSRGKVYCIGSFFDALTGLASGEDWGVLCYDTASGASNRLSQTWSRYFDGGYQVFQARRPGLRKSRLAARGIDQEPGYYEEEAPTALSFDELGRLYVTGYMVNDSAIQTWHVRRFDDRSAPSNPDTNWYVRGPGDTVRGMYFRRDTFEARPFAIAVRDTNRIYVGGYTSRFNRSAPGDTGWDNDQTIVRFGNRAPISMVLDSLRPVPPDTVDSSATGYVITQARAYVRNNGGTVARPVLHLSLDGSEYSTLSITPVNPGDTATVLFLRSCTLFTRGNHVWKCTLELAGDTSPNNNRVVRNIFVRTGDVGPTSFLNVSDTLDEGTFTPQVRFSNYGNTSATFPVFFTVGPVTDSGQVVNLGPGNGTDYQFPAMNLVRGQWPVATYSRYSADLNRGNDTLKRTPGVFVRYQDAACTRIVTPSGPVEQGTLLTPAAWVRNLGNVPATIPAVFAISGPSAYRDSVTQTVPAGDSLLYSFADWTATPFGIYAATCFTRLTPDQNRANDTSRVAFTVSNHDVGATAILNPSGTIDSGTVVTPSARVRNFGNTAASFPVWFRIHQALPLDELHPSAAAGNLHLHPALSLPATIAHSAIGNPQPAVSNPHPTDQVFEDSTWVTLAAGDSGTVGFANWVAVTGNYQLEAFTDFDLDLNRANDTVHSTLTVQGPFHDVAAVRIIAPTDNIDSGTVVLPKAIVRNRGFQTESFRVRFLIGSVYAQETTMTLAGAASDTVRFLPWTAQPVGMHVVRCTTLLAGDANPGNDLTQDTCNVLPVSGLEERTTLKAWQLSVSPNPVFADLFVRYALPRAGRLTIELLDAAGRSVRMVYNQRCQPGIWSSRLNTRDLPSGVYFLDARFVEAGELRQTGVKVLIQH